MSIAAIKGYQNTAVNTRINETTPSTAATPRDRQVSKDLQLSKEDELRQLNDQQQLTREDTEELSDVLNDIAKIFNSRLQFRVHEETERLYVQFVDRDSGEVIKQIPPEELLELSAKIQKMVGLILDKYV